MPTNRVRRRRVHEAPISRVQWALLNDEPPPEDLDSYDEHIDEWCFWDDTVAKNWSRRPAAELWQEYGAPILERLIAENPGLRPTCWWRVRRAARPAPRLHLRHPGQIGRASW